MPDHRTAGFHGTRYGHSPHTRLLCRSRRRLRRSRAGATRDSGLGRHRQNARAESAHDAGGAVCIRAGAGSLGGDLSRFRSHGLPAARGRSHHLRHRRRPRDGYQWPDGRSEQLPHRAARVVPRRPPARASCRAMAAFRPVGRACGDCPHRRRTAAARSRDRRCDARVSLGAGGPRAPGRRARLSAHPGRDAVAMAAGNRVPVLTLADRLQLPGSIRAAARRRQADARHQRGLRGWAIRKHGRLSHQSVGLVVGTSRIW